MKLALCSGSFEIDIKKGRTDIFGLWDIAKRLGFKGFEIREDLLSGGHDELERLGRLSAGSGVTLIYALKAWLLNNDLKIMRESAEQVMKGINSASVCGAGIIKLGFGSLENAGLLDSGHMEIIEELAWCAWKHGIVLCLENSDKVTGSCPELILNVMEKISNTCFRVTYDCGNFARVGYDPVKALELLSGYTAYVHLKDFTDGNENTTWLGNGSIDFTSIFCFLKDCGYEGYCCFEFPMSLDRLDEIDKSLKYVHQVY